ncbi:hypothetical protein AVEN_195178-1 [Araneus ventricosus]|uniref:Uncharacterized protein n=1 Tax=Araneus ventricosus TaxID=182803 RepID=A0A4Y2SAF5_ARAVE|nr:hypothetical protein AVEN_195178-1 [Araneus ventricosus]
MRWRINVTAATDLAIAYRFSDRLQIWRSPTDLAIANRFGDRLQIWRSPADLTIACRFGDRLQIWRSPTDLAIAYRFGDRLQIWRSPTDLAVFKCPQSWRISATSASVALILSNLPKVVVSESVSEQYLSIVQARLVLGDCSGKQYPSISDFFLLGIHRKKSQQLRSGEYGGQSMPVPINVEQFKAMNLLSKHSSRKVNSSWVRCDRVPSCISHEVSVRSSKGYSVVTNCSKTARLLQRSNS